MRRKYRECDLMVKFCCNPLVEDPDSSLITGAVVVVSLSLSLEVDEEDINPDILLESLLIMIH